MGRHRKLTQKEQIEELKLSLHYAVQSREELWAVLDYYFRDGPQSSVWKERFLGVMKRNVFCSCGRRASCWSEGKGPKMCETCMSS